MPFFSEMSPGFNYLFLLTKSEIQMSRLTLCGFKLKMWSKIRETNPTTPHPSHHLIQVFTTFQIMLLSRVFWVAAFDIFFPVCKITQDCPHTIGAAINALILFLTLSIHLLRSSRTSSVCRWQTQRIIRFHPRSPFLFISTSVSLCVSLSLSGHPHTHCQREIAMSVCPVQCVMCDNVWRTRHVPAVLGFH